MVITKKILECNHVEGDFINGEILLKGFRTELTKNGKYYITGTLHSGTDVYFKAWDNSNAFSQLKDNTGLAGSVVTITGTWNIYKGQASVILNSVEKAEGVSPDQFLASRYNIEAYWESLKDLIKSNVSENGMEIANSVLFENEYVSNLFKNEFAAQTHHDNVKGGLLAHTYKVCNLMRYTLEMYRGITSTQDEKDLYMLGALFHDIGKIREMKLGQYTKNSFVTHRFMGVEMLNRKQIVDAYGEDWYYHLVSIMLQHHGEYGDPCKSVVAFVTHKVDCFDSDITLIEQKLDESLCAESDSIKLNNAYLSLYKGGIENAR